MPLDYSLIYLFFPSVSLITERVASKCAYTIAIKNRDGPFIFSSRGKSAINMADTRTATAALTSRHYCLYNCTIRLMIREAVGYANARKTTKIDHFDKSFACKWCRDNNVPSTVCIVRQLFFLFHSFDTCEIL